MSLRLFLGRSRNAINHVLGRQPMRRVATAYADDLWLTSYPKSGNTWTRFLLANLTARRLVPDFTNIERIVPDVHANTDPELRRLERPRLIKSHEPYRPEYRRVLMIVRDPRDVAVSYFHFARKAGRIGMGEDIESFVPAFLEGRLDDYGNWGENVGSWLGARRGTRDFLLVRYEDLLADTARELGRIVEAFGIEADQSRIEAAAANSSADRLRQLEAAQAHRHKVLRRMRSDIPFVRAAVSGTWKSDLPSGAARMIEDAWHVPMRALGY